MARMHSRKRGKSGSTRPVNKKVQTWVRYKGKEVELLVSKLAKDKNSSSKIGMILRDNYGIPSVKEITGKTINDILKEKNLLVEIPEDLMALLRKNVAVNTHLELNRQDMTAKRGLQLTVSKINRLVKYYKRTGKLSEDWKYDIDKIKLLAD